MAEEGDHPGRSRPHLTVPVAVWRILFLVALVALYATAISNKAYAVTSPPSIPYHVIVRKTYALGAFALLGFLLEQSRIPRFRGIVTAAAVVGLYSAAIELGQTYISRSIEPASEHAFDIASGVVGGAVGSWFAIARSKTPISRP